jgi:L-rhamnose mutarotase
MEQIAFTMFLRHGQADEYRRRHDAIWPELVQALHDAGIRDYSIFLDPRTHVLFAVLRRTDDHTSDELPQRDVMQRWWQHMADLMETNADGSPRQLALLPMFHLD